MKAIVFLGGGRITNALVAGLRLAKYDKPILVHDRNPGKLRQLKKQYGVAVEPNLQRAVEQAGLLLIAVRPDSVSDLLREIGKLEIEKPRRPLTLVSLAAGIPLSKLRARLPIACTLGTSHAQSCVPQRARTHGVDFRLSFLSHREARR